MPRNNKRRQIMKAAERLFRNRRFHEITLDEVAQAARVSKGTIYQYFEDKDDLFFQTATSGFDSLCELLRRTGRGDVSFREHLTSTFAQIVEFFEQRYQLFRMMQAEEARVIRSKTRLRERWLEKRSKLVSAVADILHQGIATGEIRTDIPEDILAVYLLGMMRSRVRDLADVPEELRRYELAVHLFLHGAARQDGQYKVLEER